VTSEGSAYTRFRRALQAGNEILVLTTARELPSVNLDDALQICLILRGDPTRFERAAVRWLGRVALEARAATIADLQDAADALSQMTTNAAAAMERLQQICLARGIR
jgi:hypothetical protein